MLFDAVFEVETTAKHYWFGDSEVLGQIVITALSRNGTVTDFQTTLTFLRFLF